MFGCAHYFLASQAHRLGPGDADYATISTAASEQGMASRVEGGREVVHIEKRWQPWWTPLRPAPVVRPPI